MSSLVKEVEKLRKDNYELKRKVDNLHVERGSEATA